MEFFEIKFDESFIAAHKDKKACETIEKVKRSIKFDAPTFAKNNGCGFDEIKRPEQDSVPVLRPKEIIATPVRH